MLSRSRLPSPWPQLLPHLRRRSPATGRNRLPRNRRKPHGMSHTPLELFERHEHNEQDDEARRARRRRPRRSQGHERRGRRAPHHRRHALDRTSSRSGCRVREGEFAHQRSGRETATGQGDCRAQHQGQEPREASADYSRNGGHHRSQRRQHRAHTNAATSQKK